MFHPASWHPLSRPFLLALALAALAGPTDRASAQDEKLSATTRLLRFPTINGAQIVFDDAEKAPALLEPLGGCFLTSLRGLA